jgi:hypothetical protein
MKFDRIDWNRAFFKTYYEKRSFGHLLVNFNRIWVIHITLYWFYTSYNSPAVYSINGSHSAAMTWSATAPPSVVATLIMIFATLAKFSYIPTTWNNTSHLSRPILHCGRGDIALRHLALRSDVRRQSCRQIEKNILPVKPSRPATLGYTPKLV